MEWFSGFSTVIVYKIVSSNIALALSASLVKWILSLLTSTVAVTVLEFAIPFFVVILALFVSFSSPVVFITSTLYDKNHLVLAGIELN